MSKPIKTKQIDTASQQVAAPLYEKRKKIHQRQINGVYERIRRSSVALTLITYFCLPWIEWNDRQAILFDLQNREFHIFMFSFWPQDFILLAGGLIVCAFALFFVTNLAGRIWCGYTCPQTVWTKIFTWCEEITEGNRQQRIRLDKAPLSLSKFTKRGAKHLLWLLIALATALTFVSYFYSVNRIIQDLLSWQITFWEGFWILFFTGGTYLNAGWMREQVCTYMCPYARFQSVMFDINTLVISYDKKRGDPRGSRRRNIDPKSKGLGDCIDCKMCLQVCPTGIDIRNGLQIECIGCAACIDACDAIMDDMGYPRGLVRYTTENALEGKPTNIIRPRLLGYGSALTIVGLIILTMLLTRDPLALDIIRDRNALYRTTSMDMIQNAYTLKVMNMSQKKEHYSIDIISEHPFKLIGPKQYPAGPGEVLSQPISIEIDSQYTLAPITSIQLRMTSIGSGASIVEETRFFAPESP